MIKIKRGPMLERYAEIYGVDIDEAIECMTAYVNGPWVDSLKPYLEDTEHQRLESIKGYIGGMIKCSTYGRIKEDLEAEQRKAA